MEKGNKVMKGIIIAIVILVVILMGIIAKRMISPTELVKDESDVAITSIEFQEKPEIAIQDGKLEMIKEDQQYVEHQVLAVADSKHEAKKIAKAIGGELISFENQVATIQIGITVEEMMQKLEEDSSLPKVYPNYQNYTY